MKTASKTTWSSPASGWVAGLVLAAVLSLLPGSAKAWWNQDWTFRKALAVDAGATGAALPDDAGRMPVLIRLHDGNFKFTDAKEDGSDLRFIADDDKTPLHFHVEKFDSAFDIAVIWVDLPSVKAGATTNFWMYYGSKNATDAQDTKGTYDADTVLAYHFAGGRRPPQDSTAYGSNALTQVAVEDAALIGPGAKFDGASVVQLPNAPALTVADGGAFTWSGWVKPDAAKPDGIIYAQMDGPRNIVIGLSQGTPFVAIAGGPNGALRTGQQPAIADGKWHHIAVTARDKVTLYVDGQARSILAVTMPALAGTASLGAAMVVPGPGATPVIEQGSGYAGEMDEVQIAKTARSAGWVAAAVASQGGDQKLVHYGEDERGSTWSTGYVGIILTSVTIDGWVVIGLLMVMAVVSWMVMVSKGRAVQRASKADEAFLALFHGGLEERAAIEDLALGKISVADLPKASDVLRRQAMGSAGSALFHLYAAGLAELTRRFPDGSGTQRTLSAQAVEAIRATLDSHAVRETQSLNNRLVLLTIAISGGPFLGLLGTVLGVMITFASIAASGDVNINAIAPGIAAALAATVAGLIVAIPALFGYNYLITRITDLTANQQVFLDALVARLAETHRAPDSGPALAAE